MNYDYGFTINKWIVRFKIAKEDPDLTSPPNRYMHLPPTSQYFVIGSNEHQMADFYGAINAIYKNFGIKIIVTTTVTLNLP